MRSKDKEQRCASVTSTEATTASPTFVRLHLVQPKVVRPSEHLDGGSPSKRIMTIHQTNWFSSAHCTSASEVFPPDGGAVGWLWQAQRSHGRVSIRETAVAA